MNIVDYMKLLADETRLRSLVLMRREGELCVCELTHTLDLSQPKISRHLATMREAGIVQNRREGLWMYYSLHQGLESWALEILDSIIQGTEGTEPYASDQTLLCYMPNRPGAACCA